jgi:phosphatidylglycerophosphate synthase
VLIWFPNLVGYIRLGLLVASWHYSVNEPYLFLIAYSGSYLLDMLDGFLARMCG